MDGVEILNQTEINNEVALPCMEPLWIIGLIVIGVIFIALAIHNLDGELIMLGIGVEFLFSLLMLAVAVTFTESVPTGKYEYQVTISDSVNFNEFNEKYKIVKQEGKIYTIREKNNETSN